MPIVPDIIVAEFPLIRSELVTSASFCDLFRAILTSQLIHHNRESFICVIGITKIYMNVKYYKTLLKRNAKCYINTNFKNVLKLLIASITSIFVRSVNISSCWK